MFISVFELKGSLLPGVWFCDPYFRHTSPYIDICTKNIPPILILLIPGIYSLSYAVCILNLCTCKSPRKVHWGGGTDLERGNGMCGPEDPLFTPLLPLAGFQAKESVHKTPFWENLEILAFTASIFTQILAHKPPNLEIFSSSDKPPNLENFRSQAPLFRGKCQFASPTLRKSVPHTPTWKKVKCPPPSTFQVQKSFNYNNS